MKYILIIVFFHLINSASAQEIKIDGVESTELIGQLNSIRGMYDFANTDSENPIRVRLLESEYLTQDWKEDWGVQEGIDIVLFELILIIQELTDTGNRIRAFRIDGSFYDPRNYEFSKENRTITFTHGMSSKTRLGLSNQSVKILN